MPNMPLDHDNRDLLESGPCKEPYVSYDEVKKHYYVYAACNGFSVHKGTTKSVDGKLILQHFLCCKEGFMRSNLKLAATGVRKVRKIIEILHGCPTFMRINRLKNTDEQWVVGSFVTSYNHTLVTPMKRWYLRTNREIPKHARELFKTLKESNVPPPVCNLQLPLSSVVGMETCLSRNSILAI